MVEAEIAPFFRDMAGRSEGRPLGDRPLRRRLGVRTFAVAGKPAILVPLAIALDDDQGQNARVMAEAKARRSPARANSTVDAMAGASAAAHHPERLARMAAGCSPIAKPDAAERLADLVERTAAQHEQAPLSPSSPAARSTSSASAASA